MDVFEDFVFGHRGPQRRHRDPQRNFSVAFCVSFVGKNEIFNNEQLYSQIENVHLAGKTKVCSM
jgi:hypothetical protein